ncbi:cold-shock protein [Streptomyces ureilyticus]|uniref:Cold shock domain-containing protein n=1 Tax=Streptomyces ureilyticus TaxID=1775131 RepID=A0ABX0E3D1_9ACTN|nr:cold shock domain-containing protein [Streptomyces ureilyticus]NGO47349.1 cold shock domain-containing protein [Streptomyces ureilyticus]
MVAGRVVRFDSARGYGFIAPDDGDEDVFLHVNDLRMPEHQLHPGLVVEFEVAEGDRGPKASAVRPAAGANGKPRDVAAGSLAGPVRQLDGDDSLCDVLTANEYLHEVTEVLLSAAPSLTGEQILQIRRGLLQFGKNHGWTED